MLMPGVMERFLAEENDAFDLTKTFAERRAFDKYRFLDRGIAIVSELGMQPIIRIYQNHPQQFKALLTPEHPTVPILPDDMGATPDEGLPAA